MRSTRLWVVLLGLFSPGIMLAPVWPVCGLGAGEDDLLYYFPSRQFLHECAASGYWPWWNPWTGAGRSFAADPQSALWYPPTALFAVLPTTLAYPVALWTHFSLALFGMYRLLRSHKLGPPGAVFGGLVFAFGGFLVAHRVHLTLLCATAWTPIVLWRLERYARAAGNARLAAAAAVAALQCLAGHVQVAALTALATLLFLLLPRRDASWRLVGVRWLLAWFCAAGLFAVQLLPTLAYLSTSTRAQREFWMFIENAWRPASALTWLTPFLFGQRGPNHFAQAWWGPSHQCEQFGYVGIAPLLLALLAWRAGSGADDRRRAWLWVAVVGVLIALGELGPLSYVLYLLPGSSVFRVPARALLLVHLAAAALAAGAFDQLSRIPNRTNVQLREMLRRWTTPAWRLALVLAVAPLATVALALPILPAAARAAAYAALRPSNPAVWVPALMIAASVLSLRWAAAGWSQPRRLWLVIAIAMADLAIVGWSLDIPTRARSVDEILNPPARDEWRPHIPDGTGRLWVVTDTRGIYCDPVAKGAPNTNMLAGVASLTDYGPFQPAAMRSWFEFAPWGVTNRTTDLLGDPRWMRAFNVGWLLLCEPHWPIPPECNLVATTGRGWRLVRTPFAQGMALPEDPATLAIARFTWRAPSEFETTFDTREIPAGQAVRMIVSQAALPGWRAVAAGDDLPIVPTTQGLMSVVVPAGHTISVVWRYSPPGLRVGAAISGATAAVMLTGLCWPRLAGRIGPRPRRDSNPQPLAPEANALSS